MSRTIRYFCVCLLTGLMAIVAIAIGAPKVNAALEDGLVAAWTFDDGTPRDQVGKNHGKIIQGVKPDPKGKFGQAMSFDGLKDSHISVPHSKDFEHDTNFSVSAWWNVRQGRNHSGIWKGDKVGWGPNFWFRMVTTSNTSMTFGVCWLGTEGWFATDNVMKPGEWYHACQTVDGKDKKQAIAWVNAKMPPSGQSNPKPIVTPLLLFKDKPLEMGVGRGIDGVVGNDTYYDGLIDEVYIWNRALSEAEVKDLSAGKKPALPVAPRGKLPVAWGDIKREKF